MATEENKCTVYRVMRNVYEEIILVERAREEKSKGFNGSFEFSGPFEIEIHPDPELNFNFIITGKPEYWTVELVSGTPTGSIPPEYEFEGKFKGGYNLESAVALATWIIADGPILDGFIENDGV
jgi:hypothetical protein